MNVREYIEQAIDRFFLYHPTWYVNHDRKNQLIKRYEKKYVGMDMGRCSLNMLQVLNTNKVMSPWTEEERNRQLDESAWHEAGHILGYFILNYPPRYAYVSEDGDGIVTPDNEVASMFYELRRIAYVGGWAFERKHSTLDNCKISIGYDYPRVENSDWVMLGKPSIEEMDCLSQYLFYHSGTEAFAKIIHDELVSRKRLSRKRIRMIYEEGMKIKKISKCICNLRKWMYISSN